MENTLDEMIEILTAYKNGKKLQFLKKTPTGPDEYSEVWYDNSAGVPDFSMYKYRIMPVTEYRPYKTTEEFIKDSILHGFYFGNKDKSCMHHANKVLENYDKLYISGAGFDIEATQLLKDYIWADGAHCGKKEQKI